MSKNEKVEHTPESWPKFHLRSADGITTAVSREFAVKRFGAQTVSWLESGQVVGADNPRGEHLSLYTLEDSIRAASPDLLKALVELVERAEAQGNIDGLPEYNQARAAIAKANGQAEN